MSRRLLTLGTAALLALPALAGGPRWTAGSVYFDSTAYGKPVVWASGAVAYSADQGELSEYAGNSVANTMVAAAAAPWNGIPTTAVDISAGSQLAEDVSGADVSRSGNAVTYPADVTNPALPIAIIYDADGSVLNTILGTGASDASGCLNDAVWSDVDQFTATGNIAHAIIVLNGLCATNATQLNNMQYLLTREFGRVLGLDWSQANDNIISGTPTPNAQEYSGWPVLHPINLNCGGNNYSCLTNAFALRMDDRAALGRLYPSASFAGDVVHVTGTISFPNGTGMQGVNVVATRLWNGTTSPDDTMVAAATTGAQFRGNAGSAVLGMLDSAGNSLLRFGSDSAAVQGYFDLSGLEVPAGATAADYMLTFEPVNALYTGTLAVGPEIPGTPVPSGTMPGPIYLRGLKPGSTTVETITIADAGTASSTATAQSSPAPVPASGSWTGALSSYGETAWAAFTIRPSRTYALLVQALDESGASSERKLMPVLGVWNAGDVPGGLPEFSTPQPFDSSVTGTTVLVANTPASTGPVGNALVAAIADVRGDGRPDYNYAARLLYADTLSPSWVPLAGGQVVISGTGFHSGSSVYINGAPATVLLASSTAMLVRAPAQPATVLADVEIDDPQTGAYTLMSGALAYAAAAPSASMLGVISAPTGSVPAGVSAATPFAVVALDGNQSAVAGATVAFAVTQGSALLLPCNSSSCSVSSNSAGFSQVSVKPTADGAVNVTATTAAGGNAVASVTAVSSSAVALFPSSPALVMYAGTALSYPAAVVAVSGGKAQAGAQIAWTDSFDSSTFTSTTTSSGQAQQAFSVPALAAASQRQIQACVSGTTTCTTLPITAETPANMAAFALSGAEQSVRVGTAYAPVSVRIVDAHTPANPLAGAPVTVTQYAYTWNAFSGFRAAPVVLADSSSAAVSDVSGDISIAPLQVAGRAQTTVIRVRWGMKTLALFTLHTTP